MPPALLDIHEYNGPGYRPLVDFDHWRVAVLNFSADLLPEHLTSMQRHNDTDEVFVLPVYNEEETEIVNEYGPMIWEYSNEARNLFVTGELDLDKDWDEYLAKLENIGLNEYIAASQTCYDRMQAG